MNQQLQNLYALLDTGERILANPIACQLGFADVDCGSYACFIGWHARFHGNKDKLIESYYHWLGGVRWHYDAEKVQEHFGITEEEEEKLFLAVSDLRECYGAELDASADKPGPAAYIELRRRVAYLRDLITKRETDCGSEPRQQSAA